MKLADEIYSTTDMINNNSNNLDITSLKCNNLKMNIEQDLDKAPVISDVDDYYEEEDESNKEELSSSLENNYSNHLNSSNRSTSTLINDSCDPIILNPNMNSDNHISFSQVPLKSLNSSNITEMSVCSQPNTITRDIIHTSNHVTRIVQPLRDPSKIGNHKRKFIQTIVPQLSAGETIPMHPIICNDKVVVMMPEVTRVLRQVYQVLSQANYYLAKVGILSKRFTGTQLMKLKMVGLLNHDAKVCSHIEKKEAEFLFEGFDVNCNVNRNEIVVWKEARSIDNSIDSFSYSPQISTENKTIDGNKSNGLTDFNNSTDFAKTQVDSPESINSPTNLLSESKYASVISTEPLDTNELNDNVNNKPVSFTEQIHYFKIETVDYVFLDELNIVFNQKNCSLDEFLQKTQPFMFETSSNQIINVLKALLTVRSKIASVYLIKKEDLCGSLGENSLFASIKYIEIFPETFPAEQNDDNQLTENTSVLKFDGLPVFVIDIGEVVPMEYLYSFFNHYHISELQVNYYLNKERKTRYRFNANQMSLITTAGYLPSKNVSCFFILKNDAQQLIEHLSEIYFNQTNGEVKDESLIKANNFLDPVNLSSLVALPLPIEQSQSIKFNNTKLQPPNKNKEIPIVDTFIVDGEIVVCSRDVHKVIEFVGEQTASLDYHLKKLNIEKNRFTPTQVMFLRRTRKVHRLALCSYIKKTDVELFLSEYCDSASRQFIQKIRWQTPILMPDTDISFKTNNNNSSSIMPNNKRQFFNKNNADSTSSKKYNLTSVTFCNSSDSMDGTEFPEVNEDDEYNQTSNNKMPNISCAISSTINNKSNDYTNHNIIDNANDLNDDIIVIQPALSPTSNSLNTTTSEKPNQRSCNINNNTLKKSDEFVSQPRKTSYNSNYVSQKMVQNNKSYENDSNDEDELFYKSELARKECELRLLHENYVRIINRQEKKLKESITKCQNHQDEIKRLSNLLKKYENIDESIDN